MSHEAAEPVGDVVVIRETVVSYILRPDALVTTPPDNVPAGSYLARFDSGSVGEPSFALLPLTDGQSAQSITLAEAGEDTDQAPRFVRTAAHDDAVHVDYQLHTPAAFSGFAPPPTEAPA